MQTEEGNCQPNDALLEWGHKMNLEKRITECLKLTRVQQDDLLRNLLQDCLMRSGIPQDVLRRSHEFKGRADDAGFLARAIIEQSTSQQAETRRKLSPEEVVEWGNRHDIQGSYTDLSAAIYDARSLSLNSNP